MKYRKKPVVIEAIQWNGTNLEEIKAFVGESLTYDILDCGGFWSICCGSFCRTGPTGASLPMWMSTDLNKKEVKLWDFERF